MSQPQPQPALGAPQLAGGGGESALAPATPAQDFPDTIPSISACRTPATPFGWVERAPFVGVMRHELAVWAVPSYRVYFLDSADRVASTDVIVCDTEAQAQARADVLVLNCGYPGIEVWYRDRKVYRALKTEPPSDRAP